MTEAEAFQDLLRRVRAGDERAAAELVRSYEPEVRRAIHVRLTDPQLRRLLDTMDVCQSVLANFFVRAALGEFQVDTPEQLIRLLLTMARNKLLDHARRQQAGRRDHRRVAGDDQALEAVASREPSPSQVLAGRDMLEAVRARLTEQERYLAEQRGQGRSWDELAAELNVAPNALRMRFRRALDRVSEELGLNAPPDS